jgi:bacterioferritin
MRIFFPVTFPLLTARLAAIRQFGRNNEKKPTVQNHLQLERGDTMAEDFDKKNAVALLNRILEAELAGVVRYTHYSFMVYGHSRIPIVSWLREQAISGLAHAHEAGELITHFGGHPSLKIGQLLETHQHTINDILQESLDAERQGLALYNKLLEEVKDHSVLLEEYARRMIAEEELHVGEVNKMLRKPGDVPEFEP